MESGTRGCEQKRNMVVREWDVWKWAHGGVAVISHVGVIMDMIMGMNDWGKAEDKVIWEEEF